MAEEADEQRAIDRACAAQSPALLPKTKVSVDKLNKAKERIESEKEQYEHPPRF